MTKDIATPIRTQQIMAKYNLKVKKSLGQNFLIDPNAQRRIVDALDPSLHDEVMEIGPGQGALTRHLAERAGRILAQLLERGHLSVQLIV